MIDLGVRGRGVILVGVGGEYVGSGGDGSVKGMCGMMNRKIDTTCNTFCTELKPE